MIISYTKTMKYYCLQFLMGSPKAKKINGRQILEIWDRIYSFVSHFNRPGIKSQRTFQKWHGI